MMIVKGPIPRRYALGVLGGVMGGAVLAACQGAPVTEAPATVGASPTSPPAEPAPTIVLSSEKFAKWLEGIRAEAVTKGISQATIQTALTGLEPNPRVVELDRRQPEFSQTF